MLLQTSNFVSKSVLGLSLGLLVAGLAGCASDPVEEPSVTSSPVSHTLVNAESIDALAPGEVLSVDLRDNVVYHFDYNEAPIDYTRIKLIDEDGTEFLMADAMEKVAGFDYGVNPAVDLLAAPDGRFNMGWDASDLQKLSAKDQTTLEETGYLYKVTSSPSKPQNEDDCIYATCEVCPDGWGNGPCYLIHHVWCD
jgi:hypothetical protein